MSTTTTKMAKTELKEFQHNTIKTMLKFEEKFDGGLLLNSTGTGKSVCAINLITQTNTKTLIVCPSGLVDNWMLEIFKHTRLDKKYVAKYHGPKRSTFRKNHDESTDDKNWLKTEPLIYITSYHVLVSEYDFINERFKNYSIFSNLFLKSFKRIILDEGQYIRNHNTKIAKILHNINCQFEKKWVITATPLVNNINDFYSYFKFLQLEGIEDRLIWKSEICNNINGLKKLNKWVHKYSIQYKKEEVLQLPERHQQNIFINFNELEQDFYNALTEYSMTRIKIILERIKTLKAQKERVVSKMLSSHMLTLITRLKQACNSPYLVIEKMTRINDCKDIKKATNKLRFFNESINRVEECVICYDMIANYISNCGHKCCGSCWEKLKQHGIKKCPTCRSPITTMDDITIDENGCKVSNVSNVSNEYNLDDYKLSSKINNIISITKDVIKNKKEKIIIVSQYVKMLELVKEMFNKDPELKKVKHISLQGCVSMDKRTENINQFQTKDNIKICFLSLLSSSEGLTLTSANHLINIDSWWNSAKMNQVCDRIYRIGQDRDSIEGKIQYLVSQKSKMSELTLMKKWSLHDLNNYDDTWMKTMIKLID
jgi:SNF2 family DNA or RNA helicase